MGGPERGMTEERSERHFSGSRTAESGRSPENTSEAVVESGTERSAGETYEKILSRIPKEAGTDAGSGEEESLRIDVKAVSDETDEEARVTKLLSLSESKSPEYAVRVAMRLNDLYALDRLHDEMAEKFYDALVARGIIRDE
jgi:hypothetical protein